MSSETPPPPSIFGRSLGELTVETLPPGNAAPVPPLVHDRGERMPFRLRRSSPRSAEWSAILIAGGVVGALGVALAAWCANVLFLKEQFHEILIAGLGLGGLMAFGGATMVVKGLKRLLAMRIPEPTVEINAAEPAPGREVRVYVAQRGPARLEEFSVVLICDVRERRVEERRVQVYDRLTEQYESRIQRVKVWHSAPTQIVPVLRESNLDVPRGQRFEKTVTITIPADAPPTADHEHRGVNWRFEVEAQPAVWAGTLDQYPVIVRTERG